MGFHICFNNYWIIISNNFCRYAILENGADLTTGFSKHKYDQCEHPCCNCSIVPGCSAPLQSCCSRIIIEHAKLQSISVQWLHETSHPSNRGSSTSVPNARWHLYRKYNTLNGTLCSIYQRCLRAVLYNVVWSNIIFDIIARNTNVVLRCIFNGQWQLLYLNGSLWKISL